MQSPEVDSCICIVTEMRISFLDILSIWAPYLDKLVGVDREDIHEFFRLRTTCIEAHDSFFIPFRISPFQLEVTFFIMIGDKRRSQFLWYPLKTQPRNSLLPAERNYNNLLSWARHKFTNVAGIHDTMPPMLPRVERATPIPGRAKPVPKSRVQSSSSKSRVQSSSSKGTQAVVINVNVYGLGKLFCVRVEADDFVGDIMTQIEQTQGVPFERQRLYLHTITGLVEVFDMGQLKLIPLRNNDYMTLFIREREWEDCTAEEEIAQAKKKQQLEKVARQNEDELYQQFLKIVRDLESRLLQEDEKDKLKELHRKYLESRAKYRSAGAECLSNLKVFRDYDTMLATKYGRAWGPFGFGTSSSSSSK